MKKNKFAFVHMPYGPDAARLDTMPLGLNPVRALANSGADVDLYLAETPSDRYRHLLTSSNIKFKYFKEAHGNRFLKYTAMFSTKFLKNYTCIFGLGQIGIYLAFLLATVNKCPFIYINDEFPGAEKNLWSKLERKLSKKAVMIVVPDEQRFKPLCKALDISQNIPHAVLPNISTIQSKPISIDWHEKLGLPSRSIIPLLNAGSMRDWSQIPELLSVLPYWPENTVLILNDRARASLDYRRQIAHLNVPGRVIWTEGFLTEDELNSLVGYCSICFALYRNLDENLEYTGLSSGKLLRSIACGTPVIASNLPSFQFVEKRSLGVLVTHPKEIPEAINKILGNMVFYKENCLKFSAEISFDKMWKKFCARLKEITDIIITPDPYSF